MASPDLEKQAKEAFVDDDFELAVDLYTQALELSPKNADLFADRAQANIKLNNFTAETNNLPKAPPSSLTPPVDKTNGSTEDSGSSAHDASKVAAVSKPKYRHDYYNSPTEVVLSIFAKNIPRENVSVDFGEQILRVDIGLPGEEPYHFQVRLFGKIIPEKCKYTVFSSKIEIRLFKAETIAWTSLEFTDKKTIPQKFNVSSAVQTLNRPSYPSSKAKVDWDKLEAEVKKEEKEEKLEGDAALNKLFRDIYKDADPDTRRAMSKSFVESNGTVLSTNWKEVGSKKVEGSAPQGMEMKKWEI